MLLPLLACTPEGAEKEEFASTQLIINSFLDVSESRHIVRLSCETGGRTVAAEGAELYCTVGEGSPVRAEEALLEGAGAYCFCADLVRGERVRIEAVYNGLRASACVKVPDHACLLSLVDVWEKDGSLIADCSISKAYNGSPYCRLRMRLRYPDGSCSEELCQYHKDNDLLDRRLGNDASDKFFESGACTNHYCIFALLFVWIKCFSIFEIKKINFLFFIINNHSINTLVINRRVKKLFIKICITNCLSYIIII